MLALFTLQGRVVGRFSSNSTGNGPWHAELFLLPLALCSWEVHVSCPLELEFPCSRCLKRHTAHWGFVRPTLSC